MEEITLPRTGTVPLAFEGELLAESEGYRLLGREHNRYHDLTLYRTRGGQLVLAITFRSRWQGEPGEISEAHRIEPGELATFLKNYNPLQHYRGYPPGEAYTEKQARSETDIRQRFAVQVTELLEKVSGDVAERIE